MYFANGRKSFQIVVGQIEHPDYMFIDVTLMDHMQIITCNNTKIVLL